jgi:hypothetical protein
LLAVAAVAEGQSVPTAGMVLKMEMQLAGMALQFQAVGQEWVEPTEHLCLHNQVMVTAAVAAADTETGLPD